MKLKYLTCVIAVGFVSAIAFLQSGYVNSREDNPLSFNEVIIGAASYAFFETTLEGLEYRSANIVRGRVGGDSRMVFQYTDYFRPEHRTLGNNIVSLEILEVFQGNLRVGDIITIVEPYEILDGVLHTVLNYLPSVPYKEYFFFLSDPITSLIENPDPEALYGAFWVIQGSTARFPVPVSRADMLNYTAADLSLARETINNLPVNDLYMYLWQSVVDAYMDWSRPPVPAYRIRSGDVDTQHDFDMIIDY